MKILITLAKSFAPDLPVPKKSMAYSSYILSRPDLIYRYTESGNIPLPISRMLSVEDLAKTTSFGSYDPAKLLEILKKQKNLGDLQSKKVLDYIDLLSKGSEVPIMCLNINKLGILPMDGFHRLAAAYCSGVKKIKAYIWRYKDLQLITVQPDRRSKPTPLVVDSRQFSKIKTT